MPASFSWTVSDPAPSTSSTEAAPSADPAVAGAGAADLPKDLRLDSSGDLLVEANDLQLATGQDALAQDLASRLRLSRGDWFLDLDDGLPYFEDVFQKNPNLNAFRAEARAAIEATPGILELIELNLRADRATRELVVDFRARADLGELAASGVVLLEI